MLLSISTIIVGFLFALELTQWAKHILLSRAVLDIPNDRSSHTTPVPRGGGWALLAVLLPALAGAAFFIDHDFRHAALIAAVILLAGISWLDDRHHVSPPLRLALHLFAAALGSLSFTHDQTLFSGALPFWLDRTITIIGWAWFINLYNFMDGIDGITSVETICVASGICLVTALAAISDPFVSFLASILIGVSLGFLVHNWHPAKIFLGDVGSVPLGYLVGFGLIYVAVHGYPIPALILPLYYLADSGITIGKRALRREKIWQAHRQHFYQHAALGAGRHDKVVAMILAANILLFVTAAVSLFKPWAALAAAYVIVAILLQKMHKTASTTKM